MHYVEPKNPKKRYCLATTLRPLARAPHSIKDPTRAKPTRTNIQRTYMRRRSDQRYGCNPRDPRTSSAPNR